MFRTPLKLPAMPVLIVAAILGVFMLMPATASAQGCPSCTSTTVCEEIDDHGSHSCSIVALEPCAEDGVCVIIRREAAADLKVDPSQMRDLSTEHGVVALAPVGDSMFAAWSCDEELIYVARADENGTLRLLPPEPYLDRYRYSLLVTQASRQAIE